MKSRNPRAQPRSLPQGSPSGTPRTRLLLCDDQKLVREYVRNVLKMMPWVDILGEADSGRQAVLKALELQPDLVLMDLSMPDLDGIEATRQILHKAPHIRVLAFSVESTAEKVKRALAAGAQGYLLKTGNPTELKEAIEKVMEGERYVNVREHRSPNWLRPG